MAAATCDNGTEHFPDSRVIIEEGVCKLADRSAIAGSIATGIRLIRTLVEKAEIPLHDAVRMASSIITRESGKCSVPLSQVAAAIASVIKEVRSTPLI